MDSASFWNEAILDQGYSVLKGCVCPLEIRILAHNLITFYPKLWTFASASHLKCYQQLSYDCNVLMTCSTKLHLEVERRMMSILPNVTSFFVYKVRIICVHYSSSQHVFELVCFAN